MARDKAGKDDEPEKKSGNKPKKKKLVIIAAVAALVVGGGAYFLLGSGEEPPPEPGEVLALDAITVNLADGHFLKVKLALQATADAEEVDGSRALDLAVDQFSNVAVAELSNEGRAKHKADLKEKVVQAYEGDVMDIYLTDFVMQ
jgi:flagellar protein FliL